MRRQSRQLALLLVLVAALPAFGAGAGKIQALFVQKLGEWGITNDGATTTLAAPTMTSPTVTDMITMDAQASVPASPASGSTVMWIDSEDNLQVLRPDGDTDRVGHDAHAAGYISSSVQQAVVAATPEEVEVGGVSSAGHVVEFSLVGAAFQYDGTKAREFGVMFCFSFTCDTNNVLVTTSLRVDGAALAAGQAEVDRKIATGGDTGAAAITTVLDLSPGQLVSMYVECDQNCNMEYLTAEITIWEIH